MTRRKHRKSFACGHRGLGQTCQVCRQATQGQHWAVHQQRLQQQQKQRWRDSFKDDPIDLTGLPKHIVRQARQVLQKLDQGTHYKHLQGIRWHGDRSVVRIPLGRNYRLLCRISGQAIQPYAVLSHEAYNKYARGTRR
jgi:hypothetical protein